MQLGPEVIITVTDDGRGIDIAAVREQATRRGSEAPAADEDESLYLIFRSGRVDRPLRLRRLGPRRRARRRPGQRRRRPWPDRGALRGGEGQRVPHRRADHARRAPLPAGRRRERAVRHSDALGGGQPVGVDRTGGARRGPADGLGRRSTAVAVSDLAETLWGTRAEDDTTPGGQVVVLSGVTRKHAFRVDTLIGQRDVVVKGMGRLLPRLDLLAGASVEPDGSILLVLDAPGLIERARLTQEDRFSPHPLADVLERPGPRGRVLIVDDALTIRELERSILERAGYEVRTADDGIEALAGLVEAPCDLVLTDVEMPRMDGFALTEAIRANAAAHQPAGAHPHVSRQRAGPPARARGRSRRLHREERVRRDGSARRHRADHREPSVTAPSTRTEVGTRTRRTDPCRRGRPVAVAVGAFRRTRSGRTQTSRSSDSRE